MVNTFIPVSILKQSLKVATIIKCPSTISPEESFILSKSPSET